MAPALNLVPLSMGQIWQCRQQSSEALVSAVCGRERFGIRYRHREGTYTWGNLRYITGVIRAGGWKCDATEPDIRARDLVPFDLMVLLYGYGKT